MTISRFDVHSSTGEYLGYIDAPNQGAAEKIFRQKSRGKAEPGCTFVRKEVVATYDLDWSAWSTEQSAGKFG